MHDSILHRRVPLLAALLTLEILVCSSMVLPRSQSQEAQLVTAVGIPDPDVHALSYVVRIAGTPKPVLERRARKRMPPASLTKIMSAAIAQEWLRPDEMTAFSLDAKNVEPKISDAAPGEAFSADALTTMALVASDNDAVTALAEASAKKKGACAFAVCIEHFVWLMNDKAAALDLADTHFENPTGLDQDNHYTTSYDLSTVSEYLLRTHPHLWDITRTAEKIIYSAGSTPHRVQTTNELLAELPAIRGGKTGFTDKARGTLILLYPVRPAGTAIIVILGSDDRFGDGRRIIQWLEQYYI